MLFLGVNKYCQTAWGENHHFKIELLSAALISQWASNYFKAHYICEDSVGLLYWAALSLMFILSFSTKKYVWNYPSVGEQRFLAPTQVMIHMYVYLIIQCFMPGSLSSSILVGLHKLNRRGWEICINQVQSVSTHTVKRSNQEKWNENTYIHALRSLLQ